MENVRNTLTKLKNECVIHIQTFLDVVLGPIGKTNLLNQQKVIHTHSEMEKVTKRNECILYEHFNLTTHLSQPQSEACLFIVRNYTHSN